jgi:hypothetical protein
MEHEPEERIESRFTRVVQLLAFCESGGLSQGGSLISRTSEGISEDFARLGGKRNIQVCLRWGG